MAKAKKRTAPALTPEARENQLIAAAIDLAEEKILDGTASSPIIVHYLKLGSTKAKLENEKLKEENKLLRARTEALESQKDIKKLYEDALAAMSEYRGNDEIYED